VWSDGRTKYKKNVGEDIHHQLLKKTANYPGRVSYLPPPNASDDLFFATDAEFKTYRLYRIDEDPAPYYLDRKQSGRDLVKEPISTSQNALSSSVQANAIYCADCFTLLERVAGDQVTHVYIYPPVF
jgi:hypothetical protein